MKRKVYVECGQRAPESRIPIKVKVPTEMSPTQFLTSLCFESKPCFNQFNICDVPGAIVTTAVTKDFLLLVLVTVLYKELLVTLIVSVH